MTDTTVPRLYKWLRLDGSCIWAKGSWPLPTDDRPGVWIEVEGPLVVCAWGLHALQAGDLFHLIPGPRDQDVMLAQVELTDPHYIQNKWLARRGRVLRVVLKRDAVHAFWLIETKAWIAYSQIARSTEGVARARSEYSRRLDADLQEAGKHHD